MLKNALSDCSRKQRVSTLIGLIQTLDACPEFSSELFDEGFSANSLTIFKPDFI